MPIITMGFDPATEEPTLLGGGTVEIVSGRYFTASEIDAAVVVVGQALAEKNGLTISSTVDVNGTTIEIIGIYTSGQAFGDNMLVMPIDTVQRLFDLDGVTSVTVIVDDVENVDSVADAIEQALGEGTVDIITSEQTYERISSNLESAINTSQIGMISALVIAAVVIIFAVVLMVRQRIKEIGILKAIGASNWHISLQFATESFMISLVAVILGALLSLPMAQTVANMLVSSTGTTARALGGGGFLGGGRFLGGGSTVAGVDVAISLEVFLIALGIAVALAVIASIFPSWYVARIKPAEVLRSE
jgi:putative ABC transport system permease protein